MSNATDYRLSTADAEELKAMALLPAEFRRTLLTMYTAKHGAGAGIELFAQFIGLANSVVANNRTLVEEFLFVEGKMHPHESAKINLPTIFGALSGVVLANKVPHARMCAGCAYRLGTCANQSPCTTADAEWVESDRAFMCHERMDEKGQPTRKCRGAAAAARATP